MERGQLGQLLRGVVGAVLCLPLVLYGRSQSQRPPRSDLQQALFQGVTYERLSRDAPRPHVIHIVTIDLTVPGVKLFVTPGDSETLPQPDGPTTETSARTVTEFLQEFDVQVAINAGYFYLFREKTPWNYYPHSGDRVNVVGQGISAGQPYSPPQSDWPVLCFDLAHRVQIVYCKKGDYDKALEMFKKCYEGQKSVLGEEHPATLRTPCRLRPKPALWPHDRRH